MNADVMDHISIRLPEWAEGYLDTARLRYFPDAFARMQLAIELSRLNVERGTGGPFGAAIFDSDRGELIAIGMNLVVPSCCSMAHAEMVAITVAQQRLGCFDLGSDPKRCYELVTSCEPCAMCFGAIPWSGVRSVLCGARDADARAIGFDEGPKMADWQHALEQRGIRVVTDLCRDAAAAVLRHYAEINGTIYNGRLG